MAAADITAAGQFTAVEDSPLTDGTTLFSIIVKPGPWKGAIQVQTKIRTDLDTLVVDVGSPLTEPTVINLILPNGFSVRAGAKGGEIEGAILVEVRQS